MFKVLYPYQYVDNVLDINYQKLYDYGYRAIIFDVDSTLVPHGKNSNPDVDKLFKKLNCIGFKTLLLSDNSEERIKRFIKNIDTMYIYEANKPHKEGYIQAIKMLGIPKDQIVYIGDQIFTDIYGANKCGIKSILVKFIMQKDEVKIGKKRKVEKIILKLYRKSKYNNRFGNICKEEDSIMEEKRRKLFCELNPVFYTISLQKEVCKRHVKNIMCKDKMAKRKQDTKLRYIVSQERSNLIKRGKGIDLRLQENKVINISIASQKMNKILIYPGEVFSFWHVVGKITKRKGYKDGRVISKHKLQPGMGGGLCNLANNIHRLVLCSPLEVVEFHNHSDALAPEHGKRIPFSSGTSVNYNNIDYRFRNNTDQLFQLLVKVEDNKLYAELRCENKLPYYYKLVEENHHFKKENGKYYRISKIYKLTIDKKTKKEISKILVLDNHSEVMYDYSLIPKELIKQ